MAPEAAATLGRALQTLRLPQLDGQQHNAFGFDSISPSDHTSPNGNGIVRNYSTASVESSSPPVILSHQQATSEPTNALKQSPRHQYDPVREAGHSNSWRDSSTSEKPHDPQYYSPDWEWDFLDPTSAQGPPQPPGVVDQYYPNAADILSSIFNSPTTSPDVVKEQPQVVGLSPEDPTDDDDSEIIQQLSARMGSLQLAGDGNMRYYGPTSNLNLLDILVNDRAVSIRNVRHDGDDMLNHLGIGKKVPPSLEDHLIELYFTWEDSSFHVVDRDMYQEAKGKIRANPDGKPCPWYSETLTNAM